MCTLESDGSRTEGSVKKTVKRPYVHVGDGVKAANRSDSSFEGSESFGQQFERCRSFGPHSLFLSR